MKSKWIEVQFVVAVMILACSYFNAYAITGDVIKSFPTPGSCPTGLAWDGELLWLTDLKSDSIYGIDTQNGDVIRSLAAPTFRPLGLTFDGEALWLICGEEERIYRIIPETALVIHSFESPITKPTGLAWDGEYLWIASRSEDEIHQISPSDGTTIKSFPSPAGYPQGLAFDGNYLWVADRISNRIYMVDPKGGEVILLFDAPAPYADGLAWDGENLWNADFQSDSLYCLAIGDEGLYKRKDVKNQQVEFTHEVRNYGPGTMESLDIYLAVPQDLPNQEIIGEPIYSPEPTDFLFDQWGQKAAHFHFKSQEAGTITKVSMTVQAQMYDTRWFIFPERVGKLKDIPREIREQYLVNDEKFDVDNPIIQDALEQCVGDEENPYWIMRKIFSYVIDNMYYEMAGGWNTAPAVLERGNGSCSEYTFVFISLCRAAGLPTRYAGSIAIRGDDASLDDVFHRWAEVYIPNHGWIPVDPSRGDKDSPEGQAESIGHAYNSCLITTVGGGGSEYFGWTYNSSEKWTTSGKCKIYTEHIGEWNPIVIEEEKTADKMLLKDADKCEP